MILEQTQFQINQSSKELRNHHHVITNFANSIIILIKTLLTGQFEKKLKENNWPLTDQEKIKKTNIIVVGGSISTKGRMGNLIQTILKESIKLPIIMIKNSEKAALIGLSYLNERNKVI